MTLSRLRKRLDANLVLSVLLTVFAFAPLTYPGFFQSHSGFLTVFNLFDLESNLWGNWGWVPTVGGGYDLLKGEGPLPYVLAEFFRWLGLGGVEAVKAVYAFGFVASGLGAYLLGKRVYGRPAGLVAAVLYVYLPYHLATVYVRGAFAEAWAFALYPLILLCWEEHMAGRALLWAVLGVLLSAALALTNVGLALLYALFLIVYVLVLGPSRRAKARGLVLVAIGLAIALVLLLPTVMRHGLAVGTNGEFAEHFLYPFQLLSAGWGYGTSTPDWAEILPLQLGLVASGLTLLAAVLFISRQPSQRIPRRRTAFFLAGAAILTLFMLHPASAIWRASRLLVVLEYPWQLLALVGLTMSLASASGVASATQFGRFQWQAVLVTLVILASYGYLLPRFTEVQVGGSPVATLGDDVVLLSYRRDGPLLHGATVRFTAHWQCLRRMKTDYTVFVHVTDGEGTIWGQKDAMPLNGARPTSSWEQGEVLEDQYEVTIDVDGPREGYAVYLGMYDAGTGVRLPVSGDGTAVILQ